MKLKLKVTSLILIFLFMQTFCIKIPVKALENGSATVAFADSGVEKAVRLSIDKYNGPITVADMEILNYINLDNTGATNLSGLEYAVNLTSFRSYNNSIEDFTPIKNLTKLKSVYIDTNKSLSGNPVDYTFLNKYTNLTSLTILNSSIKDITFVNNLINLDSINFTDNDIVDITPLSKLSKLEYVNLTRNEIVDIEPLSTLKNLKYVTLDSNKISDIIDMSLFQSMGSLSLRNNAIKDITPLVLFVEGGHTLANLDLSYNEFDFSLDSEGMELLQRLKLHTSFVSYEHQRITFKDDKLRLKILEALGWSKDTALDSNSLELITELNLDDSNISDLEGLQFANNITSLSMSNNKIKSVVQLRSLKKLAELSAASNYIEDINSLQNLTQLYYLDLSDNYITRIDALKNLSDLVVLGLNANIISDLSPLRELINLQVLDLGFNVVSDVSAVGNLTNLSAVSLKGNYVADITPFRNMAGLQYLDMRDNNVSNVSVLNTLKSSGAFNEEGSAIDLAYNYLDLSSGSQQYSYIANLQSGGTQVVTDTQFSNFTPIVISSDPINGNQGFPANLPLTIQFNKAVVAGTNIDKISIVGDEGKIISTSTSIDNGRVIITPNEKLEAGKRYILQLPIDAFKSKADGKISDDFISVFTTEAGNVSKYKVIFNSNGGSEVQNQLVTFNSKVIKPTEPVKGGYKFGGWFTDQYPFKTLFDFSKPLQNGNVTLYAKWIPTEAYIASYLQQTQDTKLFGIYNQAKAVVYESDLSEAKKGYYLGQLARYDSAVFTEINKYFINRCIDIAANPNLTDFLALVDEIDAKLSNEIDKGYFKGQMNSWGRYQVYTPEVQSSIDAIVDVWTVKTPESVALAKTAIATVKQPGSISWLNSRLEEAVQSISK